MSFRPGIRVFDDEEKSVVQLLENDVSQVRIDALTAQVQPHKLLP